MGFFATFWRWLDIQLASYINENTARVAAALEPAVVTFGTIYVMAWGYLHLTGRVEEPFATGLKRIVTLAVVLGVCLHLWLYGDVIVDSFYRAPAQLAAGVIGASDPVETLDRIWERGGGTAGLLWDRVRWNPASYGFLIAAVAVWVAVGLLCVYGMFLIALAAIVQAVLLALGPLFVAMLLFDSTRDFFNRWLSQLAVYAFVTILTVLMAALLLRVVDSYAAQTLARGSAIFALDALNLILVAVLIFLLLRQVLGIAGALGGGFAVGTYGLIRTAVRWGMSESGRVGRTGVVLAAPAMGAAIRSAASGARRVTRDAVDAGMRWLRRRPRNWISQ